MAARVMAYGCARHSAGETATVARRTAFSSALRCWSVRSPADDRAPAIPDAQGPRVGAR